MSSIETRVVRPEPQAEAQDRPTRVLLADDQADVLTALRLMLKAEGFEAEAITSPEEILLAVENGEFDLILMDMNYTRDTTSGLEGLELLARLQALPQMPPIIVMTAWGSIDLAVEAMRRGARDFVLKPWDNQRLLATVREHARGAESIPQEAHKQPDARLERDLKIARKVQAQLFPRKTPPLETLAYSAECRQAGAVGGDYYDFLDLGKGRMALVLADVSGKGVAGALLMANLQATLRSQSSRGLEDLRRLVDEVNRLFYDTTAPEHYATLFVAAYDDRTRTVRYVNCGHNPPMILRRSSRLDRLPSTTTVLGLFPDLDGDIGEITLEPGDTLIAFSDGVTDAENESGEPFGESRLIELLEEHAQEDISTLPFRIANAIEASEFRQDDDLTVLAARGR